MVKRSGDSPDLCFICLFFVLFCFHLKNWARKYWKVRDIFIILHLESGSCSIRKAF